MAKDKDFKNRVGNDKGLKRDNVNLHHAYVTNLTDELQPAVLKIDVDPRVPPEKLKAVLFALADFYRSCGGMGIAVLHEPFDSTGRYL